MRDWLWFATGCCPWPWESALSYARQFPDLGKEAGTNTYLTGCCVNAGGNPCKVLQRCPGHGKHPSTTSCNKNIIIILVLLVESQDWVLSVLVPSLVFCEPVCFSSHECLDKRGVSTPVLWDIWVQGWDHTLCNQTEQNTRTSQLLVSHESKGKVFRLYESQFPLLEWRKWGQPLAVMVSINHDHKC